MTDHDKLREAIAYCEKALENDASFWNREAVELIVAAARSTLPRAKMVTTYRVEYASRWAHPGGPDTWHPECCVRNSEALARACAAELSKRCPCVRVTGPHQQEVPA